MSLNQIVSSKLLRPLQGRSYSPWWLSMGAAVFIAACFNRPLWRGIVAARDWDSLADIGFGLSAAVLVLVLVHLILSLLSFGRLHKPWVTLVLLSSCLASYFESRYHILFDRTMIQNIVSTDYREAYDLFSGSLLLYVAALGVLPALLLSQWRLKTETWRVASLRMVLTWLGSLAVIGLIALIYYEDYSSLLRNNRQLKNQLLPSSFLYSLYAYGERQLLSRHLPLRHLGEDARLGSAWGEATRPVLLVIVVGETARAENFSLGGYARETNPRLAQQQGLVYFNNVTACGTATAISLPCLFSQRTRQQYDGALAEQEENLLDVIMHAGLEVLWLDNNSGCKGVCARVQYEALSAAVNTEHCRDGECFDLALVEQLRDKIATPKPGKVIVLHQKGSHGPAYYERSPLDQKPFLPECRSNQLQRCSAQEIINAYDNSLAYTDLMLSAAIDFLRAQENYDTALLYVSDHGESLGESGLYLHGFPYSLAPRQQTHIPLLTWFSDHFSKRFGVDTGCLAEQAGAPLSHDNIFSSILGLLNIHTQAYDPAFNLFLGCQARHAA